MQFNSYLCYVLENGISLAKIPWMRVGTFFLKIFYLKRNEFSLECVIHVSYSIYVYLNFAVISTAIAT